MTQEEIDMEVTSMPDQELRDSIGMLDNCTNDLTISLKFPRI